MAACCGMLWCAVECCDVTCCSMESVAEKKTKTQANVLQYMSIEKY